MRAISGKQGPAEQAIVDAASAAALSPSNRRMVVFAGCARAASGHGSDAALPRTATNSRLPLPIGAFFSAFSTNSVIWLTNSRTFPCSCCSSAASSGRPAGAAVPPLAAIRSAGGERRSRGEAESSSWRDLSSRDSTASVVRTSSHSNQGLFRSCGRVSGAIATRVLRQFRAPPKRSVQKSRPIARSMRSREHRAP